MFPKPVKAVLFDMDGLLIDTEAVYIDALQAAAVAMGLKMPLSFCHSMIGIPGPVCDGMIQDFYGPDFALETFTAHFDDHAHRVLEAGVPVKAGAVELLRPERIGVTLSEEFQLHPEQATDAIVVHHPEAKYFNAR